MTRNYFPDDEEIWEELLYFLKNPITKEEELAKKKTESEYIDSVLEKAFSDSPQSNIVSNDSYLSYEDLLDDDSKQIKPLEGYIQKTNLQDPYARIASRDDLTQEQKMEKMAEIARIQNESKENLQNINREHNLAMLKHWGGFGLELGSAFVPGFGGAKLAGQVAKQIAPKVGRKIAKEIADGTLKGISQGAVEGFGRGLVNDENPLKTAVQDAVLGTALGAGGGVVGGEAGKAIKGNKFRKIDSLDGYSKEELKSLRKDATNYYNDYIADTTVKRPDMDEITFGNAGIGELRSRGLHNVKILPDLKKQIMTGQKKPNRYDYAREDIDNFDIIENIKDGKIYEYQIAKDHSNKINKFYNVKDVTKEKSSSSSDWDQYPGSKKNSNNILTDIPNFVNLMPSRLPKIPSFDEWLEELKRKRKGLE